MPLLLKSFKLVKYINKTAITPVIILVNRAENSLRPNNAAGMTPIYE